MGSQKLSPPNGDCTTRSGWDLAQHIHDQWEEVFPPWNRRVFGPSTCAIAQLVEFQQRLVWDGLSLAIEHTDAKDFDEAVGCLGAIGRSDLSEFLSKAKARATEPGGVDNFASMEEAWDDAHPEVDAALKLFILKNFRDIFDVVEQTES
jgi:hypothetical protein